jgi:basic amino acid/polyamine antiporter, APA family
MGGPIRFKQNLRLFEAITIIVGSMIGSGILLLPADMAQELPSPLLILGVLLVGALLTVVGALTFAEMAAMFPRAGGQYQFLKEGLGRFWSYLFGWTQFLVIQTGIIAGVAVAFSRFLAYFVAEDGLNIAGQPFALTPRLDLGPCVGSDAGGCIGLVHMDAIVVPAWGNAFVAIGVILLLAALNWLSSRFGGWVQNVSTVAKVLGLVSLVGIIFLMGSAHTDAYQATGGWFAPEGMGGGAVVAGFGAALALSLFAYDGWPQATYVAAEVQNAKRNLPLALTIGPLITSAIYIALAAAYFYVIPIDRAVELGINDQRIAPEAAGAVWSQGRDFISAVALVSVFGTVNGFVLTAPRVFYAFARDGAMLRSIGTLGPRNTPGWSIYFTAIWASLLVMTGSYAQLVIMVVFGIWLFYIPTAIAHIRMRRTHAHVERPYRTPLYPFVPILFLVASAFVVGIIFYKFLAQAVIASILILLGVPAFHSQKRQLEAAELENRAEDEAADARADGPGAA